MTRLTAWRQHAACRKEAIALKRRLARAEKREMRLRRTIDKMGKAIDASIPVNCRSFLMPVKKANR